MEKSVIDSTYSLLVQNYDLSDYKNILIAICISKDVLDVHPRTSYVHASFGSLIHAEAAALECETTAYCKTRIKEITN